MPKKIIISARPVHRGMDRWFDHAGINCPTLRQKSIGKRSTD